MPLVNHDLLAGIMQQNLRNGRFKESIVGKPPQYLEELLERAEKYIRIEEASCLLGNKRKERDDDRRDDHRGGKKGSIKNQGVLTISLH